MIALLTLILAAWAGDSEPVEVQVFAPTSGNRIQCGDGIWKAFDLATTVEVPPGNTCQVLFLEGEAFFNVTEKSVFACSSDTEGCVRTDVPAKKATTSFLMVPKNSGPPSLQSEDLAASELRILRNAWDVEITRTKLPDPTVAMMLSKSIGFGSGHYYAGSPETGNTHFALQGIGTILSSVGVGLLYGSVFSTDPDLRMSSLRTGSLLVSLGVPLVSFSRLSEIFTAPRKAKETAVREMRKMRP